MSAFRPGAPSFHASSRWIDRWLAACSDLAELERSNPMTDAVIDEIDGRMIRIGDQWLADFASCNYLGFDLDREIIEAIPAYLDRWGTHPSWSRMLGSPVLYPEIEERLIELLGCEDALVIPTITLIHLSVIPVLAGDGTIAQLHNLYPAKTTAQLNAMVGITLMPGLDDYPKKTENTTVAHAQQVYNYAHANGLNTLSIWAIQRDNGGCPGVTGSNSCSGIAQSTWDFSHVLEPFTGA